MKIACGAHNTMKMLIPWAPEYDFDCNLLATTKPSTYTIPHHVVKCNDWKKALSKNITNHTLLQKCHHYWIVKD